MTMNGKIGSISYGAGRARAEGSWPAVMAAAIKADQGELPAGLILSPSAAGLVPYEAVAAEVLGTGEAAATDVAAEVLGAADGSIKAFEAILANDDVTPGSLTVTGTVGAAAKTAVDDGLGHLSGELGAGIVDYASGYVRIYCPTAPDNATNVTLDYSHTPPTRTFSGTLADFPVRPGSVEITDGTETFSDDGLGRLTGDAGGSGTVDYETGAVSATFAAAPAEDQDVTADYEREPSAVLDEPVDTTAEASGLVVRLGPVTREMLKVGAVAQAAPSAALLTQLIDRGIIPV